ncbi:Protein of unknown function [Desulfotomaculum arcticum]|uniref:DUF2442 domain-containing protein n=1 Tax=Desulfotruncus arcticus DSM 17038 TaxID=1121424 RepID=A0A1I2PEA8_9FIRM|nr:DUF2442 domain-containing protein [Desulfotruncus arcticus]SFG13439.1 Protein of unknown function [Desulfotomaculum arcticum] [Desulfotruncus arcticus DSM 17038]
MGTIHSVIPLEGYRLLIELDTGSSIIVNLAGKLKTARFAELSDQAVFNNVKIYRETVIWGDGVLKIPLFELINVAVNGM